MTEFIERIYLGSSCKRGHDGRRYKSTGACVECMVMHSVEKRAKKKAAQQPEAPAV